ncbi:MAG: carbamoyltransferase HypF [Sulfuricellaceae bacterium]|nr:carbamoyltransferase HypF [Sulfuricellaceae bacterium]
MSRIAYRIRIRGQVQGVGFRPFVYRLALELGIQGWVRNDGEGVEIEAQGDESALATLLLRLKSEAPPLARVDTVESSRMDSTLPNTSFSIIDTRAGPSHTAVTPDAATCPACLAEVLDPGNRRYRYPFINCTHCGPRYTITRHLPYDRSSTSMANFRQCPACQAEYDDPLDRRFHAQPNACADCGPRLSLQDASGAPVKTTDEIAATLALVHAGQIVAVKGLGGFHLVCDARNASSVARLRERKQREEKPLAIMAANIASLDRLAVINKAEADLLASVARPIVLLQKRPGCDELLSGIAPGGTWLGAMLPYAPLHTLLFHQAAGRPPGMEWLSQPQDLLLVMTSANPRGEPLVSDNDEALQRLSGIADAFLLHDRDIVVRCDDSVVRVGEATSFIRRARGYTPSAIKLPRAVPSVLACGGGLKNTICLTRGDEAFVSQHLGDLEHVSSCHALEEAVAHLMAVLEIRPERVAHDLHPDFFSSRFAQEFAAGLDLPIVAVQHHHAHIAAVLAEHGMEEPVIGLALDGIGLGTDGGAWGGELLRVTGAYFERIGHLRPLPLPGGDKAASEPWRMAASALHALGRGDEIESRFLLPAAHTVRQMLDGSFHAPLTSSCGRLFDAAAGLLGVSVISSFEGQAAMQMEGLAAMHGHVSPDADGYRLSADGQLDFLPLLERLAKTADPALGSALFHSTLAQGLAELVGHAAQVSGIQTVVLGGGCFLNRVLSSQLNQTLARQGLRVLQARQVPPGDGGLSLGQAWVAIQGLIPPFRKAIP